MRRLIDLLLNQYDTQYVLNQQCTIGEAMIPFRGRFGLKQDMHIKPIKWVIKVWLLVYATNGCLKKFEVCTGTEKRIASIWGYTPGLF